MLLVGKYHNTKSETERGQKGRKMSLTLSGHNLPQSIRCFLGLLSKHPVKVISICATRAQPFDNLRAGLAYIAAVLAPVQAINTGF
jgi:hypothetical protein